MFSSHVAWFLVTVMGGACISGAVWLTQLGTPPLTGGSTVRIRLMVLLAAAIPLALLGALWRVKSIAKADGKAVAKLVPDRGADLSKVFTYLTTVGDLIPTFLISGVLALLLFQRNKRWVALLLPADILAQVVIQQLWLNHVKDIELTQVVSGIAIGGSGGIPSGSMARLLSVFMLAAVLWRAHDPRVSTMLVSLGTVLLFIEMVTRLYLARHLLADILGGLLLGVILTVVFGWLAQLLDRHPAAIGGLAPEAVV